MTVRPFRRVLSVVGARPNFMKLAPVARALAARDVPHCIVHTGQHYDRAMSASFFDDLAIPAPDENLEVGSASHARQTAAIMERLEPVLLDRRPDAVLVYGDVNSTVAAALVAAKLGVAVGHVEAGLRSRDWSMPEEINRVVTDRLSDLLFAPSPDAVENLLAEGVPAGRIHRVGNVMIDTLVHALPRAEALGAPARHGLNGAGYALVTLHRPANVDDPETLKVLLDALQGVGTSLPVVFPMHPRTRERIRSLGWESSSSALRVIDPVPYVEMLGLVRSARVVITDSGGLQEETSYLGIPCLTVRPNTERPITCREGTNRLVPGSGLTEAVEGVLAGRGVEGGPAAIDRWDGRAGERIAEVLLGDAGYVDAPAAGAD